MYVEKTKTKTPHKKHSFLVEIIVSIFFCAYPSLSATAALCEVSSAVQ